MVARIAAADLIQVNLGPWVFNKLSTGTAKRRQRSARASLQVAPVLSRAPLCSRFAGSKPAPAALQHGRQGTEGSLALFVAQEIAMSLGTVLLIVLILLLIGALPTWPHSSAWGYYPSGGLGLVVVILLILLLMGRI
jgi:hypothetical protein